MIITRTPFRMSFFGGGTDIPEFFNENNGSVISTTFDKYCYVTVRHLPPFFEYCDELVYSKIERVGSPDELEHPMVRNCMQMLDMDELRIVYDADLPARAGLGSSSSFAVGLLNALYSMKGTYASKRRLAEEAIHVERDLCGEAGGWQDQIAAAYGGLNRIDFSDGTFEVSPIIISPERRKQLEANLLLFFTGLTRNSFDIHKENQVAKSTQTLSAMLSLVDDAEAVLVTEEAPLRRFGELLDTTWRYKRNTGSNISSDAIDRIYSRAINAGAVGGKLLGAGGGGFLLFYVEPDAKTSVISALSELRRIPFHFEQSGSCVIYHSPEEYEFD